MHFISIVTLSELLQIIEQDPYARWIANKCCKFNINNKLLVWWVHKMSWQLSVIGPLPSTTPIPDWVLYQCICPVPNMCTPTISWLTTASQMNHCFCFKFYLLKIRHILYTKINKSIKVQIKVVKQIGRMSAWFAKVWGERLVSLQCTALHHHHLKQRVWDVYHLSCTLQLPPSLSCTSCITTAVMMQ